MIWYDMMYFQPVDVHEVPHWKNPYFPWKKLEGTPQSVIPCSCDPTNLGWQDLVTKSLLFTEIQVESSASSPSVALPSTEAIYSMSSFAKSSFFMSYIMYIYIMIIYDSLHISWATQRVFCRLPALCGSRQRLNKHMLWRTAESPNSSSHLPLLWHCNSAVDPSSAVEKFW